MLTQNLPEYWEALYQSGEDFWTKTESDTFISDFFKSPFCPTEGRVLIPGAGKSLDALKWAKRGHITVAIDFTQTAFNFLLNLSNRESKLSALKLDVFNLTPKNTDRFDIIFERDFFSSLHPGKRDEYFEVWHRMLKDDGIIIAIFYILPETSLEGPPHSSTEKELIVRMTGIFEIVDKQPLKSSDLRDNNKQLWILKKSL